MLFPTIMCGGIGSRLWPLSRPERPKQFLNLLDDKQNLLAGTLSRLQAMQLADRTPSIICNALHTELAHQTLEQAGYAQGYVIGEPSGRNTAAAAALAAHNALALQEEAGASEAEALVLLLPADHHIAHPELLGQAVQSAIPLAQAEHLVTFGVQPDRPESGYGYIERGEMLEVGFRIVRFVEKPSLERARSYLAGGRHHWNAGIFLFQARWFLNELARWRPDIARSVAQAWQGRKSEQGSVIPDSANWEAIKGTSIDYAVAEQTESGVVVPVDIGWSDIGSWESVHQLSAQDAQGNAVMGCARLAESSGCYVRSETGRKVTLLGVENLVVIDTEQSVLVMDRASAQALGHLKHD